MIAYLICCDGLPALKLLNEKEWKEWLQIIGDTLRQNGETAAVDYLCNLDRHISRVSLPPEAATFEEIVPVTEQLLTAFSG